MQWVRAGHDPDPSATTLTRIRSGEAARRGICAAREVDEGLTSTRPAGPPLRRDEVLVMATDGVWEARDGDGEMFGKKENACHHPGERP